MESSTTVTGLSVAQLWQQYADRLFYYVFRLTGQREMVLGQPPLR